MVLFVEWGYQAAVKVSPRSARLQCKIKRDFQDLKDYRIRDMKEKCTIWYMDFLYVNHTRNLELQ
jgi:hypothetical protein